MATALLLVAAHASAFEERPVSDVLLSPVIPSQLAAAANDRHFVIVFAAQRNGTNRIFRAVIDADGTVVDSRPIFSDPSAYWIPMATDGERFLVKVQNGGALLLDENGDLLRAIDARGSCCAASNGASFLVGTTAGLQMLDRNGDAVGSPIALTDTLVALGAAGSDYLVVTLGDGRYSLRTLTRGALSPPVDLGEHALASQVRVASSGEDVLIALRTNDTLQTLIVRADHSLTPMLEWPAPWSNPMLTALWNGSAYVLAFSDANGTNMASVSRAGTVVAAPRRVSVDSGVLAWNGVRYLLAGGEQAWLLNSAFTPVTAQRFASYATEQTQPHIATDGHSFLVTWVEGYGTLRAARIAADGTHLDGDGLIVTDALEGGSAATFDGRDWIVAYALAPKRVAFRHIARDGALGAETAMPAGDGGAQTVRAAASPAGELAVVWATRAESLNPLDGRIWASIDGGAPLQLSGGPQCQPDVIWSGNAFRLAWVGEKWFTSSPPGYIHDYLGPIDVTVASLTGTGRLSIDDVYDGYAAWPRAAGDFVIWAGWDGLAVRRGDDLAAFSAPFSLYEPPAIAADDRGRALVVWSGVNGLFAGDTQPFALAARGITPDVAWTPAGYVIAYARALPDPPFNDGPRVFVQTVVFPPHRRAVR